MILLDINILIEILKGNLDTRQKLEVLGEPLAITSITAIMHSLPDRNNHRPDPKSMITINKFMSTLIIAIVLLVSMTPGNAEIHKWTDSNGIIQFGDRPPETGKSEIVHIIVTQPSASNSYPVNERTELHPAEVTINKKKKKIVMYGTAWCPYCKQARNYFKKKKIRFVEYNVERLPSRMREYKKLGGTGYPLILIGKNNKMQGFSVSAFKRRFNQ